MAQAVVVSFMVRQNLSLEPGLVPWLSSTSLAQVGDLVTTVVCRTFHPSLNASSILNMTVSVLSLTQNRTCVELGYIVNSMQTGATFTSLSAQLISACGPAQSLAKSLVSQASISKLAVKQAQITEPTLTNLVVPYLESTGPPSRSLTSQGLAAIVGCLFAVAFIILVQHHLLLSDANAARARFRASGPRPRAGPADKEREKREKLSSANPMHSSSPHLSPLESSTQQRNSSGSRVAELAAGMSLSQPSQALRLSASRRSGSSTASFSPSSSSSSSSFSQSDSGLQATL